MHKYLRIAVACAIACLGATAALAQTPISLQEAVAMALEKNPAHKAAIADRSAAFAISRETRALLMPRISFNESAVRGNDPVFAFGTRLRQQRFIAADFALNRLNQPTPIGDFTSRFSGQWTLFDSFQNLQQVRRSRLGEQAAQQQLDRTDQELVYRIVNAYYAVLLAKMEVQVAEASLKTAQAVEERGHVRMTSGISVESDYLTAQSQTAIRQQDLIRARNGLLLARTALALGMGMPADAPIEPAETLTERKIDSAPLAEFEERALAKRPDLQRVITEQQAQQSNISSAKAAYGPRVNAFGSWQTDSPSLGWNGGNNWVAGVDIQFDIFDGGARRAKITREKAIADRVAAMRDGLRDQVRLEVRSAFYDLDTARQQVEVARASIASAKESLRINQDRYESGLSSVTELLRVEEASHRAQTDYWNALYRVHSSLARLELATGTLNANSAVVMP
jgi:outer membrane protein TolC